MLADIMRRGVARGACVAVRGKIAGYPAAGVRGYG